MRILGLVCETHDTGAALIDNGRIVGVLEEERHSREKHTRDFPSRSVIALLEDHAIGLADIDVITTPWDQKRLRRTFSRAIFGRLPGSLNLLRPGAQTTQNSGIVLLNFWLRVGFRRCFPRTPVPPIVNVGHHESHAAMFFVSPFEEATVVVLDGYGDDAAASVFTGRDGRLERQWRGSFFDSLGMIYTLVTMHRARRTQACRLAAHFGTSTRSRTHKGFPNQVERDSSSVEEIGSWDATTSRISNGV